MPEFDGAALLATPLVELRDVVCAGTHRHRSDAERAARTHLVFPYRGGVARISHGPGPYAGAMQWLREAAVEAMR